MQAIITKYFGPGNVRGSRIKAACERGSITIGYDHDKNIEGAHIEAARQLTERFCREDAKQYGTPILENPWNREFCTGQIPSGEYVHVFLPTHPFGKRMRMQVLEEAKP